MAELIVKSTALRRGVRLETLTIVWMAVEAALAIGAGAVARSVLLTAFGADSVIELLSGVTLLWRLRVEARGGDQGITERVETRATWISAFLLLLICVYVVLSSIAGFVLRLEPRRSWLGAVIAAAALIAMPWLAYQKSRINITLQSSALRADIAESATCAYLAGVTLVGVAINAVTGWWWIEYVAALVLLGWLIPETVESFEAARGKRKRADEG